MASVHNTMITILYIMAYYNIDILFCIHGLTSELYTHIITKTYVVLKQFWFFLN